MIRNLYYLARRPYHAVLAYLNADAPNPKGWRR